MLLNPCPKNYRHLWGLKSLPSFLLGPRRSGIGGNEALFKAIQRCEKGNFKGLDETVRRLFDYFKNRNHPKFETISIPKSAFEKHDKFIRNTPQTAYELWTSSIAGQEAGTGLFFPRTRMWAPFLANQNTWRELIDGRGVKGVISLLQSLEFSQAKSIPHALSLMDVSQADEPRGVPDIILEYSALLFVVACFDADINDAGLGTTDGQSMFELFLPKVVDGKIEPPLRQWMKYVQALLEIETHKETWEILLSFQTNPEREGKRLWQFSGAYEAIKMAGKKPYLPSHEQFDKMIEAAMRHIEKNNDQKEELLFSLKVSSLCTTFLHNTFIKLGEVVTNKDRMMLFDDFPNYYQIARVTKGPVRPKPAPASNYSPC